MSIKTRAVPAAVSVTAVAVITAILWYVELTTAKPHDPVFFYLLPIILIAIIYGSRPAWLGVIAAFVCADFFLYEPLYSLDISSRVEFGDLTCFSLLAGIGVKCAVELFRPATKFPEIRSFFPKR